MGAISYKALVITVRTIEDHMRATKRNYITTTEEHPGFVFNGPYNPQTNYIPIAAYTAHWQDIKTGEKN